MSRYPAQRRRSMSRRILNRAARRRHVDPIAPVATPRPLTDAEFYDVVAHDLERQERERQPMTIIEHAIREIERRMLEQHARIEDAKQALVYLEQEKQQILAEAVRAGLDERQLRTERVD